MRFAFIILIGEHYEHMVSLFVCSFFQDIHGSFVFHFVSSSYLSWNFIFYPVMLVFFHFPSWDDGALLS